MKLAISHAGVIRHLVTVIAVAMALYHMWAIAFGAPEAFWYRGTHLMFALTLLFLIYRVSGKPSATPQPLDYLLIALGLAPILYIFFYYEYIVTRIFYVDDLYASDMIMGAILGVIVLEATRRVIGWTLPLTAIVFLAYGVFVARLEPMRFMDQLYMTTEGIFGIPLAVSASYVLIFVLFGSFMERTGTGQLFMDFAMSLTGHAAGGPGKVSGFSSSLFGTISGSAVANVMVDGPITIPLMKRSGFPPHFAAGVEAVASTGGQIMPPIMGAAAFVMAEFIGVGYGQIIIWALIPAILYYVACFCAVHFEAKRRGLVGVPRSELPSMAAVLRERGHLFIPVLVILVVMYSGYSAPLSALAGTLACFPVALLRKSTRGYVTLPNIIDAMVDGAKNALPVALACACAGIVIAVVTLAGLGIVMPTTPAYIIMTALLVPAIVKLGVVVPAAHMFAFYFAILSAITPPVALAVFAAAGLAKSDLWSSGWAAVKIGFAGFIVPFMFAYEPALLMIGEWPKIIQAFVTATVGVTMFAGGLHGYFIAKTNYWQRGLLLAGGLMLIDPNWLTDIIGAFVLMIVIGMQLLSRRWESEAAVKPEPAQLS
jgi:TRAP-type uncharacterized transport system fused permease subunit